MGIRRFYPSHLPSFLSLPPCSPPTSPLHGSRYWSIWWQSGDGSEKGFWILGLEGLGRIKGNDTYYPVLSFPVQSVGSSARCNDPLSALGIWVALGVTKGPSQLSWAPRNSDGYPSTPFEYYFLCVRTQSLK